MHAVRAADRPIQAGRAQDREQVRMDSSKSVYRYNFFDVQNGILSNITEIRNVN